MITVIEIRHDRVRLGISAPIEIQVDREEVRERIELEIRRAAQLGLQSPPLRRDRRPTAYDPDAREDGR